MAANLTMMPASSGSLAYPSDLTISDLVVDYGPRDHQGGYPVRTMQFQNAGTFVQRCPGSQDVIHEQYMQSGQ